MIAQLIKGIQSFGCDISLEGDKLKLQGAGLLPDPYKNKLKQRRAEVLEFFHQQEEAKKNGWIVHPYGEAYEKQVGRNSMIFIFKELNGKFTVWRGKWTVKSSPDTESLIVSNVDFEKALERANNYVSWIRNRR
jgi:hypothetical protein